MTNIKMKGFDMDYTEKQAWLNWSEKESKWILRLWDELSEQYEFSKSWPVKDINEDTGMGYVSERVLTELAYLENLGYSISITC